MAVLLAFLITGCASNKESTNSTQDLNSIDRYTDGSTIKLEKGKGSGALR